MGFLTSRKQISEVTLTQNTEQLISTLTVRPGCTGILPNSKNTFAFTLLPTCVCMYLWVHVSLHSQDAVVAIQNPYSSLRSSKEQEQLSNNESTTPKVRISVEIHVSFSQRMTKK